MGISIKNTRFVDFCSDQIDVITNFSVITNVFVKRVNCIWKYRSHVVDLGSESQKWL